MSQGSLSTTNARWCGGWRLDGTTIHHPQLPKLNVGLLCSITHAAVKVVVAAVDDDVTAVIVVVVIAVADVVVAVVVL